MQFTQLQHDVLVGSLLGDGYIWANLDEPTWNYKFSKGQSQSDHCGIDKFDYLDWHRVVFHPFESSIKPMTFVGVGDKTYHKYTFNTEANSIFNELESKWYIKEDNGRFRRRKIVPQDLRLTAISACVWMMDDGSNYPKDANITLNTQGFSNEEVRFLIARLEEDLNIKATLKPESRKDRLTPKPRIYIGRTSYFDFLDIIRPHVSWKCFRYKLDVSAYTKEPHRGETHSLAKLTESQVKEVFELRDAGWMQKDIAEKFGVAKTGISLIINGKRWSHVKGVKRGTDKKKSPRLSVEQKGRIRQLSEEGLSQKQIAVHLNTNQSTISRVLKS